MECFEAGIIDRQMTDGLELTFGNAEAMVAMVERIALRKGFGNILAEGVKRAAAKIGRGSAEYAMHVKGEEIPMHEPRYKKGMGLHYGVHVTGADHCTGIHDDSDSKNLSRRECLDVADEIPTNELSPRKARMLYQMGLWRQAGNYLGLCQLVPWSYNQIRDALEAVTGWPMSHWRIMKSVERGITLARIFNQREGRSGDDDNLPGRFNQAPADGPLQEEAIDPDRFSQSRKAYYQMMGWTETGIPTYGRLAELGLEWAAKYMEDG
jgi:aldehyde:ferredoxin oxidoreductase